MFDMIRVAKRAAVSYVIFLCLAISLLWAVNLIPDERIRYNLLASSTPENYQRHPLINSVKLDEWTECILLSSGLPVGLSGISSYASTSERAFKEALLTPVIGNCQSVHSGEDGIGYNYFRYWMGAQIFTRPILYFSNVSTIRYITFAIFTLCFFYFLVSVRKAVGLIMASAIGILIATAPIYSQILILPHASAWTIGFLGAATLINTKKLDIERAILTGFVSGVFLAFFDLLNNPIVVPTVLCLGYLLRCRSRKLEPSLRFLGAITFSWLLGYIGFWAAKWLLAMTQLGYAEVLDAVLGKIGERLGGDTFDVTASAATSLKRTTRLVEPSAIVFLLLCAFTAIYKVVQRPTVCSSLVPLSSAIRFSIFSMLLSLVPMIWIIALRNHSIIHYWFVGPVLVWTLICWYLSFFVLIDAISTFSWVRKNSRPQ